MATYLVGGAVRDRLLGREPSERDWVVVGARPADLEEAGYKRVGKDFPVFLHPETGEEYALARRERKAGHGYHGFEVDAGPEVSLEADLARRDLTINAMAQASDGTIFDPYEGQADLEARRLRHVSPAFVEDPLRVLRVARFAARFGPLGFTVADETGQLMRQVATSGELEWLAGARIWREIERALSEPSPVRFFDELAGWEALAHVLPELTPMWSIRPPSEARRALDKASEAGLEADQRWAALCHCLDPEETLPGLARRLPVPRAWSELAGLANAWHHILADDEWQDSEQVWACLKGCDALRRRHRFLRLVAVLEAVARARGVAPECSGRCLRRALDAALEIDGGSLARAGWRGAALGRELERRRRAAVEAVLAHAQTGRSDRWCGRSRGRG